MMKKVLLYLLIILLIGFLAQTYQLNQGSIIILMPQLKISIHLVAGIAILIALFIILQICFKVTRYIRLWLSPVAWKKYRHDKNQIKHSLIQRKALLSYLNQEYSQAEYQFKQAYLIDSKNNTLDFLLAVHSELQTQQTTKAHEEINELYSRDLQIQDAKILLQAQIFTQKRQYGAAITTLVSDKQFTKKTALVEQLCLNHQLNGDFEKLLAFISQRSILSSTEKKTWAILAHSGIIQNYQSKNLLLQANQHYNQIPSYLKNDPQILTLHVQTLIWSNQTANALKLISKNLSVLLSVPHNTGLIDSIRQIDQKDDQTLLISALSKYLEDNQNTNTSALLARAHLYTQNQAFEKAICDYQTIINTSSSIQEIIGARSEQRQVEKKKNNLTHSD